MHKRWFALILMIAVIPGCSERRIETSPSEALYETKPRDDLGFSSFYAPEGTVLTLPPDISDADRFCFLGENIAVFSGYPETVLTLLDGNTFKMKAELVLPPHANAAKTGEGITYTDERTRELVFLDIVLNETGRIPLPENCATVLPSSDGQQLYYCTPDSLRVLNLTDKTDRPLKEMRFPMQEITGLHCSDSVVECSVLTHDGSPRTFFISAENGSLLYETADHMPLWTEDDLYFTVRMDGSYRQLLTGSAHFGPSVLVVETDPFAVTPVLSQKLVLLHNRQPDGSWTLDAYHPENGCHVGQITLPESYRVTDIQPDPQSSGLWILCHDAAEDRDLLRYWAPDTSLPEDPGYYLQPCWSRENPDLQGLEYCRSSAEALSLLHGVRIRIWTDVPLDTDIQIEPEYQIPLIRQMLRQLDAAMSQYPAGFLEELAEQTESGMLNICLVRSIAPSDPISLLHWDRSCNAYLLLTPTPELERQFHRLLSDLIDCRVLGLSDAYDSWNRADPTGSGHWERVQILETAMTGGRSESFGSEIMQEKLRQICLGIREAFRTTKASESLPWEQYLTETA